MGLTSDELEPKQAQGRPLPTGPLSTEAALRILLHPPKALLTEVPRGLKENIAFIIDNNNNVKRRKAGGKSVFWDDCGSWKSGCSPKSLYIVEGDMNLTHVTRFNDGLYYVKKAVRGRRKYVSLQPQPDPSSVMDVQRYYTTSNACSKYMRKVTWINSYGDRQIPSVAIVEYVGTYPGDRPHGNSTNKCSTYIRRKPEAMKKMSEAVRDQTPSVAYRTLKRELSPDSRPTGTKQLENRRYIDAKKQRKTTKKRGSFTYQVVQDDGTTAGTTTFSAVSSKEVLNPANLGFVGCGNMAQALLGAFVKKGLVDPPHVIASAPSDRNLSKLRTLGVKTTHDNNEVVKQSDVIFLCVKPHLLMEMIDDLNPPERGHTPLFVSIVTGFDVKALEEMLSPLVDQPRVIRTMPNTPCMVGQGCCLYTLGTYTSSADGAVINSMLSAVGMCAEIPESQMDAACGLAGSGPAYIYATIEALADGGVKMGLPRHLAQTLAAQMVKGAAAMVLDTGKHPGQLKDEVCSPGGTTIAAMHTLESNGLRNAFISAVEASSLRAKELGSKSKIKTVSCSKTLS
ncbi:uncharacterized protein [Panulirus ornatus]|uniref:uncharacterized protein isoform X2 n=1 Tax=Panulirus ornatus TaxID=150431 RepID=UPI003A836BD8